MRIAFISEENNKLDSMISKRFGRAPYLIIVDHDNKEIKNVVEMRNPGSIASSGAAIKTVQALIDNDVDVIVAGGYGPNAITALDSVGIKCIEASNISIREALKKFF